MIPADMGGGDEARWRREGRLRAVAIVSGCVGAVWAYVIGAPAWVSLNFAGAAVLGAVTMLARWRRWRRLDKG